MHIRETVPMKIINQLQEDGIEQALDASVVADQC